MFLMFRLFLSHFFIQVIFYVFSSFDQLLVFSFVGTFQLALYFDKHILANFSTATEHVVD